jgi:hypothetical protein
MEVDEHRVPNSEYVSGLAGVAITAGKLVLRASESRSPGGEV